MADNSNIAIKIAGLLNLALKAGKLILGADNIRTAKGKTVINAIIIDAGLSEGTLKKLQRCAGEKNIPFYLFDGKVADIIHKENCKAVGIADANIWAGLQPIIVNSTEFKKILNT